MNKSQLTGPDEWHQIIDGQRPSGLTVATYCRDPQRYLTQLLVNLPAAPISRLSDWLPDRWKL